MNRPNAARIVTALAMFGCASLSPSASAQSMNRPLTTVAIPESSYADIADLAVDSATIIDARIRRASPVPPESAPTVPAHLVRLYVEADVNTVIYGRDPVARRIAYLVDQPRLANGKPPRLSRTRVLLFARPVAVSNRLQLVTPAAQLVWDAGRDATARGIAAELANGTIPPAIIGVSQAFHVPGTVTDEGETQIFLSTPSGSPVSLTILRRPGERPRWAAAFGEIVDESAAAPARRTLGWYRLACGLPVQLPVGALSGLESANAQIAAQDFAFVRQNLGPCDRSPPVAPVTAPVRR
jgi:hypothetical protein